MTRSSIFDDPAATAWIAAAKRALKGADPAQALVVPRHDRLAIAPLARAAVVSGPGRWRVKGAQVGLVQRVDNPDPVEAGRQARADIAGGATGLTLVFAGAATARGFGLAAGGDLTDVLDGLDFDALSLRCDLPAPGGDEVLDRLFSAVEGLGYRPETLDFDLGLDPFGDLAEGRMQALVARGFAAPMLRADGRPHHEAGAGEAEELAAVLSAGVAALRMFEAAGIEPGGAPIGFTLTAGADHDLTVAKFRALRRLWARIEQASGFPPRPIRLHGETAWRDLTRDDAWSNVLRGTIACAGAILGGADSVTVQPFTGALGLPDAFARRLARNTPLILLEEAHLAAVADPCAGSGTYEALTTDLCHAAWRLFRTLEAEGGLAKALRSGTWAARLAASREAQRSDLAEGRALIVGVTAFAHRGAAPPAVLQPAPAQTEGVARPALPSIRVAEPFESEVA